MDDLEGKLIEALHTMPGIKVFTHDNTFIHAAPANAVVRMAKRYLAPLLQILHILPENFYTNSIASRVKQASGLSPVEIQEEHLVYASDTNRVLIDVF
jgi:hypothetical protein